MWPNEMRSVRGTGLWSNCYFRPPRLSLRDSTQLCLVVAAVDPFLSQPYSALVCVVSYLTTAPSVPLLAISAHGEERERAARSESSHARAIGTEAKRTCLSRRAASKT